MNGIVDRLNALVLKRLHAQDAVIRVEPGVIFADGNRFPFSDITLVVAHREPGYALDRLVLTVAFETGFKIEIGEDATAWTPLLAEFDKMPEITSSTAWYPELVGSGDTAASIVLFSRHR